MRSLKDLRDPYAVQNRQKREFAISGQASTADVPWLYAIEAAQGGRRPSGIGEGQGGGGDDAAAPNPQSLASLGGPSGGGGASGAADAGLPGPGLDGEDDIGMSLFRGGDRGADRGFGGADSFDRGFGDLPEGNIDDFGGYSTPLGIAGSLLPIPFGGTLGSIVGGGLDIFRDYDRADEFDPEGTSGGFGGFIDAVVNEMSGGRAGQSAFDSRIDNYQERTGTGLNDAALGASTSGSSYAGPKGVARRSKNRGRDRGADRGFGGPSDRGGRSAGASGGGFRGGDENAA